MSFLPLAAAGAAAAAYLDAKTHIRKDVKGVYNMRTADRDVVKAAEKKRLSLWYFFEDQANRMPDGEPCIWSRETGDMSWQEVYNAACRTAQYLLSVGCGPGSLPAMYMQNSTEFMILFLACWAVGTGPAMLNYNISGDGLLHCIKTAGSKVVFVDEDPEVRGRVEEVRDKIEHELGVKIIVMDDSARAVINKMQPTRPGDELRDNVKPSDPMSLFYTSGTTGMPKAAAYQIHRAWWSSGTRIAGLGVTFGPNGTRWYNCMPLYHGTGAVVAANCMMTGITLCIGRKFSTSLFWKDIRDSNATAFVYVGETLRYLLNAPPSDQDRNHNVKLIFGNGLRPDVWRRFRDRFGIDTISEFFNSTEGVFGLNNVCRGEYLATAVGHHGTLVRFLLRNVFVPVSIDTATNEIERDPATGFAKRNSYEEGGEIIVAAENQDIFTGYWNNPNATNKKFERNVFKNGDLYFRTGDALRRDAEGRWFFLDRLGDTFRWKSENVSTAEVAVVVGNHPGIGEANVYGVLVPGHDGRAGAAAVWIDPGKRSNFDYGALYETCRKNLPRYAVPVFIRLVQTPSPMHNNKQNKVPLRNEGIDLEKIAAGPFPDDKLLWVPPKGNRYVEFTKEDYEKLVQQQVKL